MAEIKRKNAQKKSQSAILKDSIMTGISYMIPVIVGGGVLQAIAKMMGGYDIASHMNQVDTLAKVIMLIGTSLWNFTVPAVAAFTAYALADKPGIAPGLAMNIGEYNKCWICWRACWWNDGRILCFMDEEDINSKELTGGYADFSHSNCHNTCLWIDDVLRCWKSNCVVYASDAKLVVKFKYRVQICVWSSCWSDDVCRYGWTSQ